MITKPLTAVALPLLMTMMLSQAMANPGKPAKEESVKAATDREMICRTLTYFFEGVNMGSSNAVESAVHPEAHFTTLDTKTGQIDDQSVHQLLTAIENGELKGMGSLRLLNLDVDGKVAMAKVKLSDKEAGTKSIHYLQLVRVGDQWRIVTQTAYSK